MPVVHDTSASLLPFDLAISIQNMWQVQEKEELRAGIWWGNLRERDYLENLGVDDRIILK
jgi:hypothetical protein